MALYERVKEYAKTKKLSLPELARKSGLSDNAIYNWKSHTPSDATLRSVAEQLGVSVEQLKGEEEKPVERKKVDLDDDDVIMTFEGRPIPPEDLELMRRLLRGSRDGK